MPDDPQVPTTPRARLTAVELADLVSDPIERVEELTSRGVLAPDQEGRSGVDIGGRLLYS